LPLVSNTPPDWTRAALRGLDALLVDHAHCEQKAASLALSLIGRFSEDAELVRAMLALALEEMRHFRQVLDRIAARGGSLTPPLPDPYVRRLRDWSFRHRGGIGPRVDLLLVCAFVEARSCERFRLLAAALPADPDPGRRELGRFYRQLADAEARHWETFRGFARRHGDPHAVDRRIEEMARAEAEVVASLPLEPRMH
jgi:tRNA-(ms[2]io[6]A)-hydroxylase